MFIGFVVLPCDFVRLAKKLLSALPIMSNHVSHGIWDSVSFNCFGGHNDTVTIFIWNQPSMGTQFRSQLAYSFAKGHQIKFVLHGVAEVVTTSPRRRPGNRCRCLLLLSYAEMVHLHIFAGCKGFHALLQISYSGCTSQLHPPCPSLNHLIVCLFSTSCSSLEKSIIFSSVLWIL